MSKDNRGARLAVAEGSFDARYAWASGLSLLVYVAFDTAVVKGPLDGAYFGAVALLVVGLGTLHGLLWGAALWVSARLPVWLRPIAWALPLGYGFYALTRSLNAYGRLEGPHRALALTVLAGVGLAVAVLGAAIALAHARQASQLARARRGFHAACLLAAAACFAVDHLLHVELYAEAHRALRWFGLWFSMFGAAALLPRWPTLRARYLALLSLVSITAGALSPASMWQDRMSIVSRPWPSLLLMNARALTDFDRDGYSSLFGDRDCKPFDSAIHPGAREVPGNDIDENCSLGDAQIEDHLEPEPELPSEPSPLDVVLITADSLRPDHLGVYNPSYGPEGRATSPELDRFARSSVVFERAYTPGGSTSIAIPSMLFGVYPRALRWTTYYQTSQFGLVDKREAVPAGQRVTGVFPLAFGDPRTPLPGWLRRRGMRTVAVTDDGFSEMLSRGMGIEREFDAYYETDDLPDNRNDAGTADLAIRVLDEHEASQKLFLWVHFFGTHDPNSQHPEAKVYGTSLTDGYDHEINYLDMQVGRLLRRLEAWPRPVAILFSSDHGDLFGKIRYHAYSITDPIARIPLIARVPGWKPGRVRAPASLIDITPTILELTSTPAPRYLEGVSLPKLMKVDRETPERVLYSDTWVFTAEGKPRVMISSAYNSTGKVLFDHVTQTRRSERPLSGAQAKRDYDELSRALDIYLERTGNALHLDSDD